MRTQTGFDAGAVSARYASVKEAFDRATRDAERAPGSVQLVAVSKLFPGDAIVPILELGQRAFGENYVQEAKAKWPPLREQWPGVELHMIGPLQSNKARDAVALFDVIETVDRESLARELAKEIQRAGRSPRLFVQVNTGEEPQKGGVAPAASDDLINICRQKFGLNIDGLMCVPPAEQPPSPHFALLRKIAERNGIRCLSMGMSADFEQAVMLGATHVRVGSAIFGPRT